MQQHALYIVTKSYITPILKDLHWLPVNQRINYKILLLTYKVLHGMGPSYLSELLNISNIPYGVRSNDQKLLTILSTSFVHHGDRSFSQAAPTLLSSPTDYIYYVFTILFMILTSLVMVQSHGAVYQIRPGGIRIMSKISEI